MHDMHSRGRRNNKLYPPKTMRGEETHSAKLTDGDVREIRVSNERQSILSCMYGVNQSVISRIQNNKSWRHVL